MSDELRNALIEHILDTQPSLRGFLKDAPLDIMAGSWDLVALSFQRGFEKMWDLVCMDHTGLLLRPLLSLWRQSVELTIKSAIFEVAGKIEGNPSHKLHELFIQLKVAIAKAGLRHDDQLALDVETMIEEIQSFDPTAARFRYPAEGKGHSFTGIEIDRNKVFQAHWIIVTWCEGITAEIREGTTGRDTSPLESEI